MVKRLAFCILACLSASVLLAQSLDDVARKERERRKKNAEAGVKAPAFGDSELRNGTAGKGTFSSGGSEPVSSAPVQESSAVGGRSGKAPAFASPSDSDSDGALKAKRNLAGMLKSSLISAEEYVKRAEAKLKWAEDHWQFVNSHTNDSYPLDEARRTLESAKKEAQQAREQRDKVEDTARREGIPPGWLR